LIHEMFDHHRRWKSVHGSTSRLPCTVLAAHIIGSNTLLHEAHCRRHFPAMQYLRP
jgi:hypothetical protein